MADLSILDGNVKSVEAAICDLPREDLEALLEAEKNGKTRKGVISALEELLGADEPQQAPEGAIEGADAEPQDEPEANEPVNDEAPALEGPNVIENCIPGTELHLGDGRKLAFGERAEVSAGQADFLRERGQAK